MSAHWWPPLALVLALGCSAAPAPERPLAPEPATVPSPVASAPSSAATAATPDAAQPQTVTPEKALLSFRRVLDAPVHSLAFGEKDHVAALGADAWLDRGDGLQKLPRPPKPMVDVSIYFGRDNLPRLMGFERASSGELAVYMRWRGGAWERGASEIGRLAGAPAGPLYGVLGHADPEVVCKRGDQCIIKRRSGWTTVAALPELARVVLCDAQAWAFVGNRLWVLDKDGFRAVEGLPSAVRISAVWGTSSEQVWVADDSGNRLHRLTAKKWSDQPSPVAGPRALWASSASDVWLAGDDGVAHYDGQSWARARGAPKGALIIAGRGSNDVWLAGASGVWRGSKESP